jgi:O-antigen ligase
MVPQLVSVLLAVSVCTALWQAVATGWRLPLLGLFAIGVVALTLTFPEMLVAPLVVCGVLGTAFNRVHAVSFGPVMITPWEGVTALLLLWSLQRWLLGHRTHIDRGLRSALLLLRASLVAGVVTVSARGGNTAAAMAAARALLPFLLVIPLITLLGTPGRQVWVIRLFLFVTGGVTAMTLAAGLLGLEALSLGGLLASDPTALRTLDDVSEVSRLRPEALNAVVVAVFLALGAGRDVLHPLARRVSLALYFLLVLLSYTRSTWIALTVALLAWYVAGPRSGRPMQAPAMLAAALVAAVVAFNLASTGRLGPQASSMALRISSITSEQATNEFSYTDRAQENEAAVRAIKDSPVVGVGLGQSYGSTVLVRDPATQRRVAVPRTFIHNQYLGVCWDCSASRSSGPGSPAGRSVPFVVLPRLERQQWHRPAGCWLSLYKPSSRRASTNRA